MGLIGEEIENAQDYFESISPDTIYWITIIGIWVEYLFQFYLCARQRKVYRNNANKIPPELKSHLSIESLEKARLYGIDKLSFTIRSELYGIIILTLFRYFELLHKGWLLTSPMLSFLGIWPSTWDVEIGRSICLAIMGINFNNLIGIPPAIYTSLVLEKKHGFSNRKTIGEIIADTIKTIIASTIVTGPIVGLIVKIIKSGGEFFFVWLWLFLFLILMFTMTVYPMMIAPLFSKYERLPQRFLTSRLEALAVKVGFPATKLFVSSHLDGSSNKSVNSTNVYLNGFGNGKRIVFHEGFFKGDYFKEEETEAILASVLGHWKLNHTVKNLVLSQVNNFIIFGLFAFFSKNSAVYEAFGFEKGTDERPILVGLIIVLQFVLEIFNTAMGCLMKVLSRLYVFQADAFANDLGYGEDLKGALIKLNKNSLAGFPYSDPFYSAFHDDYPPLLERIQAIDKNAKKSK